MKDKLKRTSKFLSLVLRHQPDAIGLDLDDNGYAVVDELLSKMNTHGRPIDRVLLEQIVDENDKKRFTFDESGERIRASQGHSIDVELALEPTLPPDELFHGTATRYVGEILSKGLQSRSRQHVHLSLDWRTATAVGQRHGKPTILVIAAGEMHAAGFKFYLSANGVWLTDHVPAEYLRQAEVPL